MLILDANSGGIGPSYSWPYSLSSGTSSITQFYPFIVGPVVGTTAIGLVTNLPGDPAGETTTHLAVVGDFLPDQIGEDFSSLFPDSNESALISDLTNAFNTTTFNPMTDTDFTTDVLPFYNDAAADGLLIPPNSNFDVVAFSTGQLIGTGTFQVVTPEPIYAAPLALLLCGLVAFREIGRNSAKRQRPPMPGPARARW